MFAIFAGWRGVVAGAVLAIIAGLAGAVWFLDDRRVELTAENARLTALVAERTQAAVANARAAQGIADRCEAGNELAGEAAARGDLARREMQRMMDEVTDEVGDDGDLLGALYDRMRPVPRSRTTPAGGAGDRDAPAGGAADLPRRP